MSVMGIFHQLASRSANSLSSIGLLDLFQRGLLSKVSSVDHEFGTCHEARLIRSKEKATVRDFKRSACALHRRQADDVGVDGRILSLSQRCVNKTRMDRVHADPVTGIGDSRVLR